MRIIFAEKGWEEYLYWQKHDKKIMTKINQLLQSITREGALQGLGKPELLKHGKSAYSRRIDETNRLVYEYNSDEIIIKSCKGHYDDK